MTLTDDVIEAVIAGLLLARNDDIGWLISRELTDTEMRALAQSALTELSKTHTITPRAPEPELKVGQVWKHASGELCIGKREGDLYIVYGGNAIGQGSSYYFSEVMIRDFIQRTGAKLVEV